ncbi:MAG TPA: gamma-glutamyl-gamma-aminobutyrate hydrolase family protein [Terriglobia bacterium]|nr:gamma-glutamyl-gamma-aminobutyrate hydrolase family protein [Terriglobia bacterium]
MNSVLAIQHIECETPGLIEEALRSAGYSVECVQSFRGQPVPKALGAARGLVVMGGPMGVYESVRFPFLRDEMRLIERTLREAKSVLGICLGSQLLAAALGSEVRKGAQKEIGWHAVTLAESALHDPLLQAASRSFTAYHWHGDVFDVPAGATSLASSDLTACQGFRYGGNAYGFLFHMEITPEILTCMLHAFRNELEEEHLSGNDIASHATEHLPRLQTIGRSVFEQWAALLGNAQG